MSTSGHGCKVTELAVSRFQDLTGMQLDGCSVVRRVFSATAKDGRGTGGARGFMKTPRTLETTGTARSATASHSRRLESSKLGVFDISVVLWTLLM